MNANEELVLVFTGSIVEVERIKAELELNGIFGIGKDGFRQGIEAGFGGGIPDTIDLFVLAADAGKAQEVINDLNITE